MPAERGRAQHIILEIMNRRRAAAATGTVTIDLKQYWGYHLSLKMVPARTNCAAATDTVTVDLKQDT
jgi:hypothetical protein